MLRDWLSHADYQKYLLSILPDFFSIERDRVLKLEVSIAKLYLLNLDNVHPVIEKLYSNTGRIASNQQGIIRSLMLMLDRKVYSISEWASIVTSDPLLRAICGFDSDNAPSVASYYDFINRLWRSPHQNCGYSHPKGVKYSVSSTTGVLINLVNALIRLTEELFILSLGMI